MQLVFYNHTAQISGAEKMLLMGLAHLPRDVFKLALVCPGDGPLLAAGRDLGVPVYRSRALHARFTYNPVRLVQYLVSMVSTVRDLRRTFRALDPDILHANTVRAGIVATIATVGMRTRIVWHNHDMLPRHPLTAPIRLLAYSSRRIHIVSCSWAAADTLMPLTRGGRTPSVIHNGREIDGRKFDGVLRRAKRNELGFAPDAFAIGIVGQVTPRKGQLELIRAFAEVKAQLANAVLVICGAPLFNNDDDYLERLRREVTKLRLDREVLFLGQRPDAPEVINALDVCVLNSRKEPFALTLIEAMLVHTPVIATACGGPTEMIRNGIDGEIVPTGDQRAMVNAIVRLAQDAGLRSRYTATAAEKARQKYSRERYIDMWCNFYLQICDRAESGSQPLPTEAALEMHARGER